MVTLRAMRVLKYNYHHGYNISAYNSSCLPSFSPAQDCKTKDQERNQQCKAQIVAAAADKIIPDVAYLPVRQTVQMPDDPPLQEGKPGEQHPSADDGHAPLRLGNLHHAEGAQRAKDEDNNGKELTPADGKADIVPLRLIADRGEYDLPGNTGGVAQIEIHAQIGYPCAPEACALAYTQADDPAHQEG